MRNISLIGRVVADAEIKQTKNGANYLEFRFANNEYGDPEGTTYWFRVSSFQPNAISIKKYITKGKPLFVEGRYHDRVYTTQSGATEIGRDITAYNIEFISTGERNGEQQQPAQTAPKPAQPIANPTVMPTAAASAPAAKTVAPPQPVSQEEDDLPF